jgi:hypothetical protein
MAGRHRQRGSHDRIIPAQRRAAIDLVDSRTQIMHRVTGDELLAGRRSADHQAFCGMRVLGASLTDPGRARCTECAQ